MTTIDWNTVPDVITKEQFYKLCHISKRTAMYLLRTGKAPCQYSGKQTRCYKIRKADMMQYMEKINSMDCSSVMIKSSFAAMWTSTVNCSPSAPTTAL